MLHCHLIVADVHQDVQALLSEVDRSIQIHVSTAELVILILQHADECREVPHVATQAPDAIDARHELQKV